MKMCYLVQIIYALHFILSVVPYIFGLYVFYVLCCCTWNCFLLKGALQINCTRHVSWQAAPRGYLAEAKVKQMI